MITPKFKIGDIIQNDRALLGKIVGITDSTYTIKWGNMAYPSEYFKTLVEDSCKLFQSVTTTEVLPVNPLMNTKEFKTWIEQEPTCSHDWRNKFDGLKHYKWCAKCGEYERNIK